MRTIQYFSDEYLERMRKSTPSQIATFLENYRTLQGEEKTAVREKSKLISLRVPTRLLSMLKEAAKKRQVPYQSLMKQMLEEALE